VLLYVALDYPLAEMDGAGQVVLGVLALFADIDEMKGVTAVEPALDLIDRRFVDAILGVLDELKEARGMMVCHVSSRSQAEGSGPLVAPGETVPTGGVRNSY
jgi:hypothetical protein